MIEFISNYGLAEKETGSKSRVTRAAASALPVNIESRIIRAAVNNEGRIRAAVNNEGR